MEVWVAYVTHAHGTELYAADSERSIYQQVADYCRTYADSDLPLDNLECITMYFDATEDEWYGIEPITI
jgi:hypothetical protein